MQEASFQGFFKAIIYIIGFYYLVKILSRIFLPIIMRNLMNKAQENFQKHQQNGTFNQGFDTQKSEPENPVRDFKKPTKQVGEYVDYEEIND